jgi:Regulator of chromosome condensation (RCC1) repeat/Secretion system C-terminal sorting domain
MKKTLLFIALLTFTNLTLGQCYEQITFGGAHTVGKRSNGTLWGWGLNSVGQLGNGTTIDTFVPTQVGTATNWQSVSCNYRYAVALRADGSLWSWGYNIQGQLGNGTTISSVTPAQLTIAGCALGNEEFAVETAQLIVSPNPVGAELNLSYQGASTVDTIVIYDLTGKEVYRIAALGSASFQSSFSVGNLASGSYVVSLVNASGVVVSKQFLKH